MNHFFRSNDYFKQIVLWIKRKGRNNNWCIDDNIQFVIHRQIFLLIFIKGHNMYDEIPLDNRTNM